MPIPKILFILKNKNPVYTEKQYFNQRVSILFNISFISTQLLLVLAALFGVILYRTILTEIAYYGSSKGFIRQNSKLIISTTASILNFIVITIMDVVRIGYNYWFVDIIPPVKNEIDQNLKWIKPTLNILFKDRSSH